MPEAGREIFGRYLQAIPDDLLAAVAADCAWLEEALGGASYRDRIAMCREEGERRRQCLFGWTAAFIP